MEVIDVKTPEDWLSFFFRRSFRGTIFLAWNAKYDWNALTALLPSEVLEQMAMSDAAEYNGYLFRSFGNKFFRMKRNNHIVNLYDVCQFYDHHGLEYCASRFLGQHKNDVDASQIDYLRFQYDSNYNLKVKAYCAQDSKLCYELAVLVFDELSNLMNEPVNKPISPAYLSGNVLKQIMPANQIYPKEVNEMLLKAYHGGRFECIQKGYFESIYEYDISSAYPYAMSTYPFSLDGVWFFTKEPTSIALYGVYEILLNVEDDDINSICPVPYDDEASGVIIYPNGKLKVNVIKPELEFLDKYGYEYEIVKGYEYRPSDKPVYLFNEFTHKFYNEKEKNREINPLRSTLYKLILNTSYGLSLQLTYDKELTETNDIHSDYMWIDPATKKVHFYRQKPKNYRAGQLFNLYLASYITSLTRIRLFELTKQYENDVISYATDGVYMLKDIGVAGSGLGSWKKDTYESGIVYGNGLYVFDGKERTRGLQKGIFSNDKVIKEFEEDKIKFQYDKPLQLKEAYRQGRMSEFNRFVPVKKELNLNNDMKRIYAERITLDGLKKKSYQSYPITVDEYYSDRININRALRYQNEIEKQMEREMQRSDNWDSSLENEENMKIMNPKMKDILFRDEER